jgi:hypothetical protein
MVCGLDAYAMKRCSMKRKSKFWYILYYVGTRQVRENTKTNDYSGAYNMLIERRADVAEGKPAVSDIRRYRYEDIRDSYMSTLKLKKRVSLYSRTDESGQSKRYVPRFRTLQQTFQKHAGDRD